MSASHTARTALLALLTACGGTPDGGAPAGPASDGRPNVLIVTLDTTRADRLSPFGGPPEATPTAARLAREGVAFTEAFTVTPLTIPAHSSLMSGVLPPRHGVRDNGDFFLGDEVVTLAERFRDAGWATMASVGAEVTSHHWGFAQGFDAYFDDMGERTEANRWRVERRGDAVLADALGWFDDHAGDGDPWFAWVHLFDAHHPYQPPEAFAARFPGRPYLGEIAYADSIVGQLLDRLGPELDRTWVFVLGDHGEGLGAHGEGMHGMQIYNATTHIPLLVRPPGGLPEGRRVDFPVSIVDVTPTALAAAGLPVPELFDGIDLGPWIAGPADPPADRAVYMESLYGWHHFGLAPQRAIFDGRYKLIDNLRPELYRADDPAEREDVAPIREAVVERMRRRIDEWAAAMTPIAGGASRATLDPAQLAQLEALGYVTGGASDDGDVPFRQDLPDPALHRVMMAEIDDARKALQAGDLDEALARVRAFVDKHPEQLDALQLLASIHLQRHEPDEALAVLARLDAERPSADIKATMGVAHLDKGDPAGAVVLFEAALDTDPYLARAWVPLLHARMFLGDTDALVKDAAEAMQKLPEVPGVYGMYGLSLALQGSLDDGEALIRKALAADPHLPFMQHALCATLRIRGRIDEAIPHCQAEIRDFPPAIPTRRLLVEIYARQKRYADQLAELDALRKVEAPNPLTAHATAQALFNLKRYDESLQVVRACEAMDPTFPPCKLLEANVLDKLGRPEEARAAFEEAKRLASSRAGGAAAP